MSPAITKHIVPALLALIAFFVTLPFMESVMRIAETSRPAIIWHGVKVENKTVRPGDTLSFTYLATVNRQCPSDLRGFIIAPDGTVPVRFPIVAGGYSRPSTDRIPIRVSIVVPKYPDPGLPPFVSGEHRYRTVSTRFCPNGVEDDILIPDVKFHLEVP